LELILHGVGVDLEWSCRRSPELELELELCFGKMELELEWSCRSSVGVGLELEWCFKKWSWSWSRVGVANTRSCPPLLLGER
jgi:hypothetical protein